MPEEDVKPEESKPKSNPPASASAENQNDDMWTDILGFTSGILFALILIGGIVFGIIALMSYSPLLGLIGFLTALVIAFFVRSVAKILIKTTEDTSEIKRILKKMLTNEKFRA